MFSVTANRAVGETGAPSAVFFSLKLVWVDTLLIVGD